MQNVILYANYNFLPGFLQQCSCLQEFHVLRHEEGPHQLLAVGVGLRRVVRNGLLGGFGILSEERRDWSRHLLSLEQIRVQAPFSQVQSRHIIPVHKFSKISVTLVNIIYMPFGHLNMPFGHLNMPFGHAFKYAFRPCLSAT
jgi:hypothetical protein